MIEMSNGKLFFVVLASRGMGIQHVSHQDAKRGLVWLGWESPVQSGPLEAPEGVWNGSHHEHASASGVPPPNGGSGSSGLM